MWAGDSGIELTLEVVRGNAQFGAAGRALGEPIVLRVTEGGTGRSVSGGVLDVRVLHGDGWVDRASLTTDDDGTGRLSWVLGHVLGTQRLRIEAGSDHEAFAQVFAVCEGAAATASEVVSGEGQRAPRGEDFAM